MKMIPGRVVALVGAQYGSEGKGKVAAAIADQFDVHVRTGGPNAGHTFYHDGVKWVCRGLPCGFINPRARLVIGPGAVIDIDLLRSEVEAAEKDGHNLHGRLYIDPKAMVIDHRWHDEGGVHGEGHQKIGSTGEGVGRCRMAHMARGVGGWEIQHAGEVLQRFGAKNVTDTSVLLEQWIMEGYSVLLEGTQGCGLSLVHGEWPYVTSNDTNAGQLAVDAGLPPGAIDRTILVARTYPIRVAGNSGPLKNEKTWGWLGVEAEVTTVTKKVRRVGEWDWELMDKAVRLNRPCDVFLTFIDYLHADDSEVEEWGELSFETLDFVARIEDAYAGVNVIGVGTGPKTISWRARSVS